MLNLVTLVSHWLNSSQMCLSETNEFMSNTMKKDAVFLSNLLSCSHQ